ncbi:MAG: hypothetical protein GY822_13305 [Deltaproteobacteria bacterium]|nr:hypothetical protein [Deltaproteobacteria bacterium]
MSKLLPSDDFSTYASQKEYGVEAVYLQMKEDGLDVVTCIRGLRFIFSISLPEAQVVVAGGQKAYDEEQEAMANALLALAADESA